MDLLKWIEILLKLLNVWSRLKEARMTGKPEGHPLRVLDTVVVDLKREKWKIVASSPPEAGFLDPRKKERLLPSVFPVLSLPEWDFLHP